MLLELLTRAAEQSAALAISYRGKSLPVFGSLNGCLLFAARNCADIS